MATRSFEYHRPKSLEGAVELLKEYGDRAKILSGGQSLIPLMKLRLAAPEVIVDIGKLKGLDRIREEGDGLRIGALVRHRDLETSRITQAKYPLLAEAAASLGDPEVRNAGTIGGSVAHADPASDWGAALLAFDTQVVAVGPQGERTIPIDQFYRDTFATALEPNEILTEFKLPKPGARSGGAYMKLKRKTGDFATVAVAAQVGLDDQGRVARARIGLAAAGPTPVRVRRAEEYLHGKLPDEAHLQRAAEIAADDANPTSDLRGSEEYKKAMVAVYTRRALERALERARG